MLDSNRSLSTIKFPIINKTSVGVGKYKVQPNLSNLLFCNSAHRWYKKTERMTGVIPKTTFSISRTFKPDLPVKNLEVNVFFHDNITFSQCLRTIWTLYIKWLDTKFVKCSSYYGWARVRFMFYWLEDG